MHQFNSECDPAYEYLTAMHAFPICIALELSLHLCFLPLSAFFLSIVTFQEFPPGRFKLMPKPVSFPLSSHKNLTHPPAKNKDPKLKIFFIYTLINLESAARFFPGHAYTWLGCTWRLTFWPLPSRSWPLNSLLIIRPSPPINLLPRESQETGSCDPVV